MVDLSNKTVLIVATDGFENSELFEPKKRLEAAGATVRLASPKIDPIQGETNSEKADTITPDMTLSDARAADYDALLLPGGVGNPDKLRMEDKAVQLAKDFAAADKPIAAICHAPWLLVTADLVDGKTMTSWPSVRTDLANAGANVVDQEVAVDGRFITSRNPDDIPAFSDTLIEMLGS